MGNECCCCPCFDFKNMRFTLMVEGVTNSAGCNLADAEGNFNCMFPDSHTCLAFAWISPQENLSGLATFEGSTCSWRGSLPSEGFGFDWRRYALWCLMYGDRTGGSIPQPNTYGWEAYLTYYPKEKMWRVTLREKLSFWTASAPHATYELENDLFDCSGINVFDKVSQNFAQCTFPPTVTLNAVDFGPSHCDPKWPCVTDNQLDLPQAQIVTINAGNPQTIPACNCATTISGTYCLPIRKNQGNVANWNLAVSKQIPSGQFFYECAFTLDLGIYYGIVAFGIDYDPKGNNPPFPHLPYPTRAEYWMRASDWNCDAENTLTLYHHDLPGCTWPANLTFTPADHC